MARRKRGEPQDLESTFWGPHERILARALKPFVESTDPEEQKIGKKIKEKDAALRKKAGRLSLKTASEKIGDFIRKIEDLHSSRRAYLRVSAVYQQSLRELGLLPMSPVSLATEGSEKASRKYGFSQEKKDLVRQYARNVVAELATAPGSQFQDGMVPVQLVAREIARKIFGEDYNVGRRYAVIAMMLGGQPERYGLNAEKKHGKRVVYLRD